MTTQETVAFVFALTTAQTAKGVGLSERTLERMRQEGTGPAFVKIGERRIGYTPAAIESWLAQRTFASTSAATVAAQGAAA